MSDLPKKKLHERPVVQLLTVLVTTLGTSAVSIYKAHEARVEAETKARVNHDQAQAGYAVTVQAMRSMEEKTTQALDRVARLEGQMQIMAKLLDHHTDEWKPVAPRHMRAPVAEPMKAYEALGQVRSTSSISMKQLKLPTDLEQAVEWGHRKVSP